MRVNMGFAALQSTKKPWAHLLILPDDRTFDIAHSVPPNFTVKTVAGGKCKTKAGLLSEFARALSFPDYFGHNWDALEECLADLDWLPASGYVVVVADAEQVLTKPDDEDDYETFIEILAEAGETWSTKRFGSSMETGIPFHTVLLVSEKQKHKRRNWLVPTLSTEKAAVDDRKTGKLAKTRVRS
jgi:RNAse (barnase) inhibitor barstar